MTKVAERIPAQSGWRIQATEKNARTVTYHVTSGRVRVQDGSQSKAVREAVLGHIKALRRLGNTRVNTRDIAIALGLSRSIVEQAVAQLGDEGVKVAK